MAWEKSSEELIEQFYAALPDDERVERRKMFGYPCAFVNGNMFTGTHQHSMMVRLDETNRAKLLDQPGAQLFEPMPGRAMKEYVQVPEEMLAQSDILASWVQTGFAYALSLPPKEKKAKKK